MTELEAIAADIEADAGVDHHGGVDHGGGVHVGVDHGVDHHGGVDHGGGPTMAVSIMAAARSRVSEQWPQPKHEPRLRKQQKE